jgi:hypothetical protein
MATMRKEAEQAVIHARAAVEEASRQGGQMATRFANKTVKQARKTIAQVRKQATDTADDVVGKITGRTQRRRRAKVVAIVGAAAVATAAGVAVVRRRRR